jgi:hypothetical protein
MARLSTDNTQIYFNYRTGNLASILNDYTIDIRRIKTPSLATANAISNFETGDATTGGFIAGDVPTYNP